MAQSSVVDIPVSLETFNEIANALEARNVKINPDAPITITKDIKIKGPVDYRQVTIRRDVLEQVVKVYEPQMDQDGRACISDSSHFINFFDDVYNYILKGTKPTKTQPFIEGVSNAKGKGWGEK